MRSFPILILLWGLPVFALDAPGPAPSPSALPLRDFRDEIERDFPLRSFGKLEVANMRGDVTVQGWALDKIRVKAKRRVQASSEEESRKMFSAVDFRYRTITDGNVELSAEYGRGLAIEDRLKERRNPRSSMEIQVFAPSNLRLSVWAVDGKVIVKNRNNTVEARTSSGQITIEDVKADTVSILCAECPISLKSIRASVHVMGGTGAIDLNEVKGSKIYVETRSGAVTAQQIHGEQLYVSKTGSVTGKMLQGQIEFYTQNGSVEIRDASGYLSGRTESGDIQAKMLAWSFHDKALIESLRGSIAVTLPPNFSGDVDVWSVNGKASVGFPIQGHQESTSVGPEPANHFLGHIGDGGELLKVFSEKGDVRVLRGS